ncbi:glutamate-5-semialdehyde dehydrogenase [bacterium BFN5]|nr:glutamate-5-semialdehyde dehydrogenase [bacterium BFN5]QJW46453.1 glutamate-5-semialdehyde dehydrogenase [bacterium BFN5]
MDYMTELKNKGQAAKTAARKLAVLPTTIKNNALMNMADALTDNCTRILAANAKDLAHGKQKGLTQSLLDRLMLDETRISAMAEGLRQIAALPDPIGEGLGMQRRPNGLEIAKVRVPLGVIGIIYEARPNVTVDAAGLCLKAGNAVILRGGSEAIHSNIEIITIISAAAYSAGIPEGAIQFIETTDRQAVNAMLKLNQYLDVIIPRGGAGLIKTVVENSTVPVIETGTGVCHTFVDQTADLAMAKDIAFNAKVSRPAVCNSMETLLVHQAVADKFLPDMLAQFSKAGVELRGCPETMKYSTAVLAATEEDWQTEYHDLILSVKVVCDIEAAIDHIDQYSTRHSEAIVTQDYDNARRFQHAVDAAAVYVNASTRFTDGFEFGFGAEIGISTQKIHARGPMGLPELTSIKYVITGNGQIR